MTRTIMAAGVAAAALVAHGAAAAPTCALPATIAVPHGEGPSEREPRRVLPIGSYTLSLIWLPQACRRDGEGTGNTLDCAAGAGKRGFVLHGLWPDGRGKEWPQWCAPAAPLPAATLRAHYCTTPSVQLTQHEWTKHGTCMAGTDADAYLARSRTLFAGVRMPDLRALSYRRQTARSVQRAVAAANRGMTADMLRLNVDRDGWLEEVWLCLDTAFRRRACPVTAGGAAPGRQVRIWRGGGAGRA